MSGDNGDNGGLRVGAARMVITPPIGVSLAGSYTDRRAVGLRDDLYARAFVVDDGAAALAVVACDVIGLRASTAAGARRRIDQTCGIPPEHVLIHATHNHSGPLTRELVASGLAGEPDEPYLAHLERQIAAAVQVACWRRAPARLRLARGEAPGIAFNRRFAMREGPVRTNPGKRNPDIVRPAGPLDPRVWTLTALPAGEGIPTEGAEAVPPNVVPLGMLVNFGLHPAIVGGTVIGGDFPHFLEAGVQRLLGPGGNGAGGLPAAAADPANALAGPAPVVVFANAPCGDINHLDVSHGQRQTGFAEAARVGTILAAEAAKAACRLVPDWELPLAGSRPRGPSQALGPVAGLGTPVPPLGPLAGREPWPGTPAGDRGGGPGRARRRGRTRRAAPGRSPPAAPDGRAGGVGAAGDPRPHDDGPRPGARGRRGPPYRRPGRRLDRPDAHHRGAGARDWRSFAALTTLRASSFGGRGGRGGRGASPGDRRAPRRGLCRTGARPARPLALRAHPRARPGQRGHRLRAHPPGLRRGRLRAHLQPPGAGRRRAPGRGGARTAGPAE